MGEVTLLATDGEHREIDPEEIHDILRNGRRRQVIEQLRGRLGAVSLRELSETIAARETGERPPPSDARASVYNSLHQTHLPKLERNGVVEYDTNAKTVRLLESARHVNRHMGVMTRYGVTWSQFYRTLGVIGLFSVVVTLADVPVVDRVPALLVATLFLIAFAVATSYQLWSERWFYARTWFSGSD